METRISFPPDIFTSTTVFLCSCYNQQMYTFKKSKMNIFYAREAAREEITNRNGSLYGKEK